MNKSIPEQTIRGLKATTVALKLPVEKIDYEALIAAIQKLTPNERSVLVCCFDFVDDGIPYSIQETYKKLNIDTSKEAVNRLRKALISLNSQKDNFYPHKNSNISTFDELNEMLDLNLSAYRCLQKADKHSLENIESMTLQELMDLPGLRFEDFSNILMAIDKYRRAKRILKIICPIHSFKRWGMYFSPPLFYLYIIC